MKVIRKGKIIEDCACELGHNELDLEQEYDTWQVIEHFRNKRKVTLEHALGWLMGGADWAGNEDVEAYITDKLNEFIQQNPPSGVDKTLTSINSCADLEDRQKMFDAYVRGVGYKKREEYKHAIYDLFYNK